jgi:Ras-related protein Rab-7A
MVDNKVLTKVVILGNLGVGKTRLMNVYCGDNDESTVTVAQDCRKMEEKVGATNVTLQLWDTAGQEKYNSINFSFYRGANCCILVFDITDVESFERLNKWKTNFVDAVNPSESDNFPYIVVGQKLDLEAERKVSEADARAWCESQKIKNYFETSA